MRVKIEVTVNIDQEAWEEQFDVSSLPGNNWAAKTRADVRQYAESALHPTFEHIGVLK